MKHAFKTTVSWPLVAGRAAGRTTCGISGLPIGPGELVWTAEKVYSPLSETFVATPDTGRVYRADVVLAWRFRPEGNLYVSDFQRADTLTRADVERVFVLGVRLDAMNKALGFASYVRTVEGAVTLQTPGGRQFTTFDGWWRTIGQHALAFRLGSAR